jgi:hypothetical protein
MTAPPFGATFVLLQQEGFLIHSCLAAGLTALRSAHVGDKGPYYTGFFQTSIAFERLMKVIVILDHMGRNDLAPPPPNVLKELGHRLLSMFESIRLVPSATAPHPLDSVQQGSIEYEILEHLSSFANGARYFNLDTLASGGATGDPLAEWNRILGRILREDVPRKQQTRVSAEASAVADALREHSKFLIHGLDRQPLSMDEAIHLPALSFLAAQYAIYRLVLLLTPLRVLLSEVTGRVMQLDGSRGARIPSVPFMEEFVQFIWLDKKAVLRKKRWP